MSRPPHQRLTEIPDEPEVPPDVRRSSRGNYAAGCLLVAVFFVFPAVLYLGIFAVLMVEELSIGSGWFRENLPEPVLGFLQAIYSPLIWLLDQLDG